MKHYCLSVAAEKDLAEIYLYTRKNFGMTQAEVYVADLKMTCAALAESPRIGRETLSVLPDLRRHEHAQHVVFYQERERGILIIRILGRRQYWQKHLS